MGKKLSNEDMQVLLEPGSKIIGEYVNSKLAVEVSCINGHVRLVKYDKLKQRKTGSVCRVCSPKVSARILDTEEVLARLSTADLELVGEYVNTSTDFTAKHKQCGHTRTMNMRLLRSNAKPECRVCKPYHMTREVVEHKLGVFGIELVGEFDYKDAKINVKYTKCGHTASISRTGFINQNNNSICYTCNPYSQAKKTDEEVDSFLATFNLKRMSSYSGTAVPIEVKFEDCGHTGKVRACDLKSSNAFCSTCYPRTSNKELDIRKFIASQYKGWTEYSERKILEGKELDIVLPDLGVAFEFNGDYWHSDRYKDKTYHLDKTNLAESMGFKLVHISEHDWVNKLDIVKSRISAILGNSTKVFARKTSAKAINWQEAKEFLATNHIQGAGSPTSFNYGLFLQSELIAVMTFAKPRFDSVAEYELVRYCSLLGVTVVGGASKLLSLFEHKSSKIVSYADRQYSTGGLYFKLGFKHSHNSVPNYKYIKASQVLTRYQCQKHLLKDMFPGIYSDDKTEEQIMQEAGYLRVYDSGSMVFYLN